MIHMVGPHDRRKFTADSNAFLINVTSQSTTWTREFSPFLLGPCNLYDEFTAQNVENAWQYAKVYPRHVGSDGNPTPQYWDWAIKGWASQRANRYPMGKGMIPTYSWWDGERLGYVAAKQKIYIPLYKKAVEESGYLPALVQTVDDLLRDGAKVGFFDFDVYDLTKEGLTYDQVLNSNRKLGHAFVLASMVEKEMNL